jgi:hypothetical protein
MLVCKSRNKNIGFYSNQRFDYPKTEVAARSAATSVLGFDLF